MNSASSQMSSIKRKRAKYKRILNRLLKILTGYVFGYILKVTDQSVTFDNWPIYQIRLRNHD